MSLAGKKVLCLIHHDFEDLELLYPYYRLIEAGASVIMAGEKANEKYIGKYGVPHYSDVTYASVDPNHFDALLVPGGWAPDRIRRFQEVLELVRHFDAKKKPIGQICHAGWVLISAKILKGRTVTSTPGIKDDMENAGAIWVDEPAVADGNIISAQRPPDLPAYMRLFVEVLAKK
jgi:protease I